MTEPPLTEAYEAIGRKRRVALLPDEFKRYACARYQTLRSRGFEHAEAVWLIKGEPEYGLLPWWAMLLASVLFQLLLAWWRNRNSGN